MLFMDFLEVIQYANWVKISFNCMQFLLCLMKDHIMDVDVTLLVVSCQTNIFRWKFFIVDCGKIPIERGRRQRRLKLFHLNPESFTTQGEREKVY